MPSVSASKRATHRLVTIVSSYRMTHIENDQGEPAMQLLVEIITEVLATGVMPMAIERRMHQLLDKSHLQEMNEGDIVVIEAFIEALRHGRIQPTP